MPVHLYGQMADLRAPSTLAPRGIRSSRTPPRRTVPRVTGAAGEAGHASAFSFYPGKNLGAMGDAGAVVTNDEALASRVRALREHGQFRKYHHDLIGWTARLDTIQAAVLLRKLPESTAGTTSAGPSRPKISTRSPGSAISCCPQFPTESFPVWHLFVVRTADPDGLAGHLRGDGIGTGRHYPEPPHLAARTRTSACSPVRTPSPKHWQ